MISASAIDRFWKYIRVTPSGCWMWTGARTGDRRNYPAFDKWRAHRFAYEYYVGPIPKGLTLDHLCRHTLCCNPEHLEPVTRGENVLRGKTITARNKAKKKCKRGHWLVGYNVIRRPSRPNSRECRMCANERRRVKQ